MTSPCIHPGEQLAETLAELGMSSRELAAALDIPANRITEIVRGRRGVSADTALRLGRWLGTGPDVWMNLQKAWELRTCEEEHGAEIERAVAPRPVANGVAHGVANALPIAQDR